MNTLKVQHLNVLIKFYASQIWKRIEEVDKKMHIDELQNVHVQDEVHQIYLKYQFYELVSEKDLEYTKKLNDRIIKIFSFFKWKSKNQFVLNLIEQNIQTKLNNLYDKKNLGDIIKFIMDSVSKGSLIKQKQDKMKSKSKFFIREVQPETTKSNNTKRKTASVLSSVRPQSITKQESRFNKKQKYVEAYSKMYSGLNLDKNYILKHCQNSECLKREMQKRNEGIMNRIKHQKAGKVRNKMKTESDLTKFQTKSVLKEVNNQFEVNSKKAPVMSFNNWSRKKRKMKTSDKKRKINNQNTLIIY